MASGHSIVIATLGDSLTDEYAFYGPLATENTIAPGSLFPLPANINTLGRSSSRNWVENLAQTRSSQVTFGAYSTVSRGEVRNQGYAEDWARTGATATGPAADGSATTFSEQINGLPGQGLPGLLTQTAANSGYTPKNINVVTILIGGNDYVQGLTSYAQSLGQVDVFEGGKSGKPDPINSRIEASIQSAVTQVRRTIPKAKIVVISPPDVTASPVVASALATGASVFPDLGRTVSGSVAALNSDLARFAGRDWVGFVDFQTLAAKLRKSPKVDGVTINLKGSGQDITDGFVGDGFHPGSVVQGVLAQAIVNKVDAMYGSKVITPLTNADIVDQARAGQPHVAVGFLDNIGAIPLSTVNLAAIVSPGSGSNGATPPTGTVTFESLNPATSTSPATLGDVIGTVPIGATGLAIVQIPIAAAGSKPIIAVYSGDQFNVAVNSSVVNPNASFPFGANPFVDPIGTTTSLTLSRPANSKQVVVATKVIGAGSPILGRLGDGTVTLDFPRHRPVKLTLAAGQASASLPIGQVRGQTVRAVYSGNATLAPSQTLPVPIGS